MPWPSAPNAAHGLASAAGELDTALNTFGVAPKARWIRASSGWLADGLACVSRFTRGMFEASEGYGYLHVPRRGELEVSHPLPRGLPERVRFDEPSLLFYPARSRTTSTTRRSRAPISPARG